MPGPPHPLIDDVDLPMTNETAQEARRDFGFAVAMDTDRFDVAKAADEVEQYLVRQQNWRDWRERKEKEKDRKAMTLDTMTQEEKKAAQTLFAEYAEVDPNHHLVKDYKEYMEKHGPKLPKGAAKKEPKSMAPQKSMASKQSKSPAGKKKGGGSRRRTKRRGTKHRRTKRRRHTKKTRRKRKRTRRGKK